VNPGSTSLIVTLQSEKPREKSMVSKVLVSCDNLYQVPVTFVESPDNMCGGLAP
jgi:hypothetical protein